MRLLERLRRTQPPVSAPAPDPDPVNDAYVASAPSPQNALDIFRGEWLSQLPPPLDGLHAGSIDLFDDARIKWLVAELGDLDGRHVLELGPLEGGHSFMLGRSGAASVTAIEANTRAYLKCLIAKELLGMERVRFLCGDFVAYLHDPRCPQFDVGVACGVLYHMINPVELISLLARHCQAHLFIWTHYYDQAWATANNLQTRFPFTHQATHAGFTHTLVRHEYGSQVLASAGFCGGTRPYSHWMLRDEILACVRRSGFPHIRIGFDEYQHPNGPAFALLASRA